MVNFHSDNARGECPGVLVKRGHIGILVLQEWWGINEPIKALGVDIAQRGDFTVLIPDLYRGKVATDRETAGHYMKDLDWVGAVKDIQGAAKYLLGSGCRGVGVTGFCMGGALSLAAAAMVSDIQAAVPFYGIPNPSLCDLSTIEIPLQCHFGEKDEVVGLSSPADYQAMEKELAAGGVEYQMFTYNAGHAFVNPTSVNYNQTYAEEALTRTVDFFKTRVAKELGSHH